jgi:hypothetical protein
VPCINPFDRRLIRDKPREELLIRFPVQSRDMGLMSAIPRERPPDQPISQEQRAPQLPPFEPASPAEALDLATLEAIEQGVSDALATHPDLLPETVYRAIAHEWVSAIHQDLVDATLPCRVPTELEHAREDPGVADDA